MMNFFDSHLHLRKPSEEALEELLSTLRGMENFRGGLLVLNTPEEVEIAARHRHRIPPNIVLVPFWNAGFSYPDGVDASGWYKLHPSIQKLDLEALPEIVSQLEKRRPRGVMVHCFPWGAELQYNVSLPLVIQLAKALPESTILATHGGGYESWAFRAHAGAFRNVHFDFSMTLDYYEGSDVLRPLQRYMKYSPERIHFGSDWPSGRIDAQLEEISRLARETGISSADLETMLLENARANWPEIF